MKRVKTPEELAIKVRSKDKDKFTLYLSVKPLNYLKERAAKAGVSLSEVVDEAISQYIETIKDKSSK